MRKIAVLFVFLVACIYCGFAQAPSGGVFGGYSYLNIDTNGLSDRQSAHGWETGAYANFTQSFGVEWLASGAYKTYKVAIPGDPTISTINVDVRDYAFVGGPRFNYYQAFAHALFGLDHLSGGALGVSDSQNGFAMALGGGAESPIKGQWGIRVTGDYVLSRHNILGGDRWSQHNFRFGASLVYHFGREMTKSKLRELPSKQSESVSRVTLLGITGHAEENGFRVESVAPDSLGQEAGVRPGDVVTAINDQRTRTADEISAVLTTAKGEVTVTYLAKGWWQAERKIALK
jgi:membrane-associated protease RseP (regulator of RpoE activity)